MSKKPNRKRPSLVRHTRESVTQEIDAWMGLIKGEWKWILVLLFGLLILVAFTRPLPPQEVYLAVGQRGSVFGTLGEKFVPLFAEEGIDLHLIYTAGSAASLAELVDKDELPNAALMVGGIAAKGKFQNLLSLGSVEYVPLWLFYRGPEFESRELLENLSGKRVAVGLDGSAEQIMIKKLLGLSGISLEGRPNLLKATNQVAAEKLISGEIDAMLIMDGIDGQVVQRLLADKALHIANFAYAPAYVKKLPFLKTVSIPMGSLDLQAHNPTQDIQMLASSATLLVEDDMHPVVQQIFLLAADKISNEIDQFFADPEFFPAYIDHAVPLSPIAKRFYDEGPPAFRGSLPLWLVNYVGRLWFLVVGAAAVVYPLLKIFPNYRHMRSELLIGDAYSDIQKIEQEAALLDSNEELQSLVDELNALDAETTGSRISAVEISRLYSMKSALNLVRTKIVSRLRDNAKG